MEGDRTHRQEKAKFEEMVRQAQNGRPWLNELSRFFGFNLQMSNIT